MKVYIAGPMTGYVDHNFPAFRAAAEHLRSKGYDVVSPAEMDDDLGMTHEELAEKPHQWFMRRDIEVLLGCDLILFLPGWKHSKGAQGEKYVADLVGIDELVLADVDLWRTWEGEPEEGNVETKDAEPVKVTHVRRHSDVDCDAVEGDGQGNAWCIHGVQVQYAPELPQASDKFPDVPYVRKMSGCNGERGGRCSLGAHVVDGANNLVHIEGPTKVWDDLAREAGIA